MKEREPICGRCQRPVHIFKPEGIVGPEAEPFTQLQIRPCQFCAETERLRGAYKVIMHLIDEREK